MKGLKIGAIILTLVLLFSIVGCTTTTTKTVQVAATTVTQWTSAVTETKTITTQGQPVVVTVTLPKETITQPPVTHTVTTTLPQITVNTTSIITSPPTTVITTATVTATPTLPPATATAQSAIRTNIALASDSTVHTLSLAGTGAQTFLLALSYTNTTAQAFTDVRFSIQMIMSQVGIAPPVLTNLVGLTPVWIGTPTAGANQVYTYYSLPNMAVAPNQVGTLYITVALTNTTAQLTILQSSVM